LVVSPLERVGFNHGRPPDENEKRVSLPASKTSRLFLQHNLFLWWTGSRRRNCTSSVRRFGKIANITPMMMLECWVIVGVTLLKGVEFDTKIFIVFSKPGFWPRLFFLSSGAVIASTRRIPPSGQAGWTTSHAGLPSYSPGFLVCGLSEHAVHRRLWCFGTGGVTNSLRSAMSLRRLNC